MNPSIRAERLELGNTHVVENDFPEAGVEINAVFEKLSNVRICGVFPRCLLTEIIAFYNGLFYCLLSSDPSALLPFTV